MCGINFIINTNNQSVKEPLAAMQKTTLHRGPDATHKVVHTDDNWHLGIGANRLQVVDKDELSNQPMVSANGNYVMAYNGEVYNFRDLKNKLIVKGYEFKTNSDTEVVFLWLQEYGAKGISDLQGMFALVFVNLADKKVIIARDRHGIKPLFYYKTNETLIISSSIKAIEACGLASLAINKVAIDDYLSYRHVMGNYTFYKEVQSHEPGLVSVVDKSLEVVNDFVKVSIIDDDRNLKNVLIDTVSLVFESTTQPGLMLSGGVDSTLLLAILNKELGISGINTYTLECGEDKKWAKKAAVQYNSHHQEISLPPATLQRIDEFIIHTDQPIADHGAFATWVIAERAAKNSNTLLSGAGADELFAGYNRHRAFNYYLKNQRQALWIQDVIKKLGLIDVLPQSVRQLFKGLDANPVKTYQNFLQNHGIKKNNDVEPIWKATKSLTRNLDEALKFDQSHYLVADVLAITDNATMQHSVEARVPYLHDDLVNYAGTISSNVKIRNNGKGPLKNILADYGGIKYTKRSKLGFGLPLAPWLRDKGSFSLWEFLDNDSPIFEYLSKLNINQLIQLHQQGKRDYSMQLWSILVLEKWLKHFYR